MCALCKSLDPNPIALPLKKRIKASKLVSDSHGTELENLRDDLIHPIFPSEKLDALNSISFISSACDEIINTFPSPLDMILSSPDSRIESLPHPLDSISESLSHSSNTLQLSLHSPSSLPEASGSLIETSERPISDIESIITRMIEDPIIEDTITSFDMFPKTQHLNQEDFNLFVEKKRNALKSIIS
jgi:hypothetical protein